MENAAGQWKYCHGLILRTRIQMSQVGRNSAWIVIGTRIIGPICSGKMPEDALPQPIIGHGLTYSPKAQVRRDYTSDHRRLLRLASFRPDLLVEGKVLVEIKARSRLLKSHWAQFIHYLRISGFEIGLVVNFGRRAEFKRIILSRNAAQDTQYNQPRNGFWS